MGDLYQYIFVEFLWIFDNIYILGRQGTTPMVLGRNTENSSWITLILKKVEEDSFGAKLVIITAFIGAGSRPELWDRNLKTQKEKE